MGAGGQVFKISVFDVRLRRKTQILKTLTPFLVSAKRKF